MLSRMWRKRTLLHCWWDCKLVQPVWKSVRRFLRKLDIVLPEDPAIPLLGMYPEEVPTGNKNTCSTMFIAAFFIIARSWKQPRRELLKNMMKIWKNSSPQWMVPEGGMPGKLLCSFTDQLTEMLRLLQWVHRLHKSDLVFFFLFYLFILFIFQFYLFCGDQKEGRHGRTGDWIWSGHMMWNSQWINNGAMFKEKKCMA